jgi:hypothetical protein
MYDPEANPEHDPHGLLRKAAEHFGFTHNPKEAGWMLPNGKMLDFSGKHRHPDYQRAADGTNRRKPGAMGDPDLEGYRHVEHAQIGRFAGGHRAHFGYLEALQAGAVRVDAGGAWGGSGPLGIEVGMHRLTGHQEGRLQSLIHEANDERRETHLDVIHHDGHPVFSRRYDHEDAEPRKIFAHIHRKQEGGGEIRSTDASDWIDHDDDDGDDDDASGEGDAERQVEGADPYHAPAGSPQGGRFVHAPGGGGTGAGAHHDRVTKYHAEIRKTVMDTYDAFAALGVSDLHFIGPKAGKGTPGSVQLEPDGKLYLKVNALGFARHLAGSKIPGLVTPVEPHEVKGRVMKFLQEELIHAADLQALRSQWTTEKSQGRFTGDFSDYADHHAKEFEKQFQQAIRSADPKTAKILKGLRRSGDVAYGRSHKDEAALVFQRRYELVRQLVQLRKTSGLSDSLMQKPQALLDRLLGPLIDWFRDHVLRAMHEGLQKVMGHPSAFPVLKGAIEDVEKVINQHSKPNSSFDKLMQAQNAAEGGLDSASGRASAAEPQPDGLTFWGGSSPIAYA